VEDKTENMIWQALDKFRGRFRIGDTKLLEMIAQTQGQKRLEQILSNEHLVRELINDHAIVAPQYVYKFILDLAKTISAASLLDPWATLASPIVHWETTNNATAIFNNKREYELVRTIFPDTRVRLLFGDNLSELDNLKKPFDFICSILPFGLRGQPITIGGYKTSADVASMLLLKSATLLTQNGLGVFLVSPSFLLDKRAREVLKRINISIPAIFSIPSRVFLPYTSMSANLVLLSRHHVENTFIAGITADERTNKIVFDNYQNRREGKALLHGSLADFDSFVSLQALLLEREMQENAKRIGYPPIVLTDIASKINALKTETPSEVEHLHNSIYLPKVGNSEVVTDPSAMKIKPKNYYQIQLNSEKADASFVANYFNSQSGKKLRESLKVGATILQIPMSRLTNCALYIPNLKTQSELLEVDSRIEQLGLRLEELKRNLWRNPRSYKKLEKDLNTLNQESKLEQWIDTLPFPISSILWRYYATKENSKKVAHLFHFFEALSEFFAMIMLSALVQDVDFYRQECHKWTDKDAKFKNWYLSTNFGNWNVLTSRLAKSIRGYLADEHRIEFCKEMFGNPSDAFLNMLTNKGIVNVLLQVAVLRNQWKGHGSITNEEEDKQRVIRLEQHLNELRKVIADGFDDTKIIAPMKGEYEEGIHTVTCRELVGAKSPFHEEFVKSLISLDIRKLYLVHANQNRPIELLPFIKYIESSDACYFYTSIESSNVRWVSYHFDKDPEIKQPVENGLKKVFELLKGSIE